MSNFVTIEKYSNPVEANIAKGKLEDAGISVFLKNELLAGIQPYFATSSNVIELQVSPEAADAAREILATDPGDADTFLN